MYFKGITILVFKVRYRMYDLYFTIVKEIDIVWSKVNVSEESYFPVRSK